MLKNTYLDAKISVDPAENEPRKEWQVVTEAPAAKARRVVVVDDVEGCADLGSQGCGVLFAVSVRMHPTVPPAAQGGSQYIDGEH